MHYEQDSREARSVSWEVDLRYGPANFAGADRRSLGDEVLGLCGKFQEAEQEPEIKQEREAA
jgi:hypothetical protein